MFESYLPEGHTPYCSYRDTAQESNETLKLILRDYLKDFSQYHQELNQGQLPPWMPSEETPKTKWEKYAEIFFGLYLNMSFNAEDGHHLVLLAKLQAKSKLYKDDTLTQIIANYFSTME
eukprot:TRINITY_DN12696_c0_g1_i1.p2 TRINITY_DN12696_c0_g1~~TRINITY_DN12696_c0_g1_i1.p2  ORF type:complete len:119 (+),score=13.25 TRINITY_DN12696_c0_g1_i1:603-959(+)